MPPLVGRIEPWNCVLDGRPVGLEHELEGVDGAGQAHRSMTRVP